MSIPYVTDVVPFHKNIAASNFQHVGWMEVARLCSIIGLATDPRWILPRLSQPVEYWEDLMTLSIFCTFQSVTETGEEKSGYLQGCLGCRCCHIRDLLVDETALALPFLAPAQAKKYFEFKDLTATSAWQARD